MNKKEGKRNFPTKCNVCGSNEYLWDEYKNELGETIMEFRCSHCDNVRQETEL